MSVKDDDLMINIQDGLKGDIVSVVSYDNFYYGQDSFDLNINLTDITYGEFLIYNTIRKLLINKKDIIIKFGQKN